SQHVHDGSNRRIAGATGDLVHVSVADSWKVPEKAFPRLRRQHRRHDVLARVHALAIEQPEEERLVPDDRTAVTGGELFAVVPGGRGADAVAVPGIRIERRVLDVPYCGSAELIGPRPCQDLDLSDAS